MEPPLEALLPESLLLDDSLLLAESLLLEEPLLPLDDDPVEVASFDDPDESLLLTEAFWTVDDEDFLGGVGRSSVRSTLFGAYVNE